MNFDYVVVGGGTAGCLLASRILEAEMGSVLVLEAGAYPVGRRINVPALYHSTLRSRWDWSDRSSSQSNMHDRVIHMPRGLALGGSSQINAMIYCQGHPADFEAWKSLGIRSWDWETCKSYYDRSCDFTEHWIESYQERKHRRLRISQPELQFDSSHQFLKATQELGWTTSRQATRFSTVGCRPYLRTQFDGRRTSSWSELLKPLVTQGQGKVITEARVEKIGFQGDRARQVHFLYRNQTHCATAHRAILLTAGAFQSPALLLRSGVGCKNQLRDVDIEAKIDLPAVGTNLQDHLVFPVIYSETLDQSLRGENHRREVRLQYCRHRDGPLASNMAEVGAFGTLDDGCLASGIRDLPEFQVHVTPNHYFEYATRENPRPAMSLGVTWLRPSSRGNVRLHRISETEDLTTRIDPNYLSSESDIYQLVRAVQLVRQLRSTDTFLQRFSEEIFPGNKVESDELLSKRIRRMATTIYHPVGTCRIGGRFEGVVDEQLRVHGIEGLWVADASVIPVLPTGNTQAIAMMIAERCFDFLCEA